MAAQITMGNQEPATLTMRTPAGTDRDTEIEEFPRAGREESGALHDRRLACRATPFFGRCHKSPVSTRRSNRCSTVSIESEKLLFKPSLNKEIHSVEHLGLESRRVLGSVAQCQFGKNRLDSSTNGWKLTTAA